MLDIKKIDSVAVLKELKAEYFASSTAPLDGMWHFGFVPMSDHFGFYEDDSLVGFCVINSDSYMLQFYLSPTSGVKAEELFSLVAQGNSAVIGDVKGAFVSTAEPRYQSLCLDNSSGFTVNAKMYQHCNFALLTSAEPLPLQLAAKEQLSEYVAFAVQSIGAPEEWLTGYYGNLIDRQELWGYWVDGQIFATGECRLFDDYQTHYADLGMIVAPDERGKGIATGVLLALVETAKQQGLTAMCSTESNNISAQKAIEKAGLRALNRLVQFTFAVE
ncbi:GNAT family N-acetyltransferase [Vibrio sp. 10N.286.49.C2]|uniref:GNAT family N-acetyltransferase n=1 Tax=unclassified Vibrio TaxID=2614977 RepID=UPI000C84ABC5|nr:MULTISPECIES: GNAT family N-acetyltransferase [unclassified Vibrio]PMH33180.1 GNAT family N-acetyltransferase [Vibrio sp. 10N.286.49.C2]PMH51206.1 GNAT family N-acetyltransferase [Vibrio sp. 10N.286.49.B1]PMH81968.1 GNAT family N-acetyltransferase [Vibrio sp. 10N.286.48.B7]